MARERLGVGAADDLHPLFIDGLPADFANNATLLAIANADAPSDDEDDSPATATAGTRGTTVSSTKVLRARVAALRQRHAAEKIQLDTPSCRAGRLQLRSSGSGSVVVPERKASASSSGLADARHAILGADGVYPSAGKEGKNEDGITDEVPLPSTHDSSVAALCTFMHVWKPGSGSGDSAADGAAQARPPSR